MSELTEEHKRALLTIALLGKDIVGINFAVYQFFPNFKFLIQHGYISQKAHRAWYIPTYILNLTEKGKQAVLKHMPETVTDVTTTYTL